MHLAILVTNTDDSDFAARHPNDSEKFADLIHLVRPDWTCTAFQVHRGRFPDDITGFDGALITGSPASVRGDHPWVPPLLNLIRDMHARRQPLFGACFGHQAIALALGGQMGSTPSGWVHGLTRNRTLNRPTWAADLPDMVHLYGSHIECVTTPPAGALPLSDCDGVLSGFALGCHIYTTQHHPEMSHAFITALTEEMRDTLGPDIHARALSGLAQVADQHAYAESLARFFEQAKSS